ncbi:MAG: Hsp20/alpha crystallin family protein [Haliscomenobacter sp.]|nr:Hsp20/alpha crystallin family protein [Haliscomenobacter sp.]MBK8878630.1 Hsp20/alpha crystallin family protein [Haliscomenobacter sp.]
MKLIQHQPVTNGSRIDQFVDEFFNRGLNSFFGGDHFASSPSVNVFETNTDFLIEVAAPGLEKHDFEVKVEGAFLIISSEKEQKTEQGTDGKYLRKEFNYATFSRSFRLPESVQADKIKASYENGVLKLTLPKAEMEIQKYRTIEIE